MTAQHQRRQGRAGIGRDTGSATAELAVVLPALVLVAVLCVWAVGAAATHGRCLDAARAAARELARGEPPERVQALAQQRAPEGARIRLLPAGVGLVAVEVRKVVSMPGGGRLVTVDVGGQVVASVEPGPGSSP